MSASSPLSSPHPRAAAVLRPQSSGAQAFGLTDWGLVRASNEDAYAVVQDLGLHVVADGVGGHAAGEVASRLAVDSVVAFFRDIASGRPGPGDGHEVAWQASFASSLFARAVEEANAVVCSAAASNPSMRGMATTFTGLLLRHEHAVLAHVGDSRAYLVRGRRLHQLTEDHSAVAAYVRAGVMTAEQAARSELRGKILRAVGLGEHVEVDTRVVAVEPGDTFLICSDGLHDVVEDDAIAAVLLSERDLTRAAVKLIDLANEGGGPDNVTVVLARVR